MKIASVACWSFHSLVAVIGFMHHRPLLNGLIAHLGKENKNTYLAISEVKSWGSAVRLRFSLISNDLVIEVT